MILTLLSGRISILEFTLLIIGLVLAVSFHEFAHSWVAYRLGDSTAKLAGRLTLNPKAHLDPVGSLLLLLVGFGWGRPVPINTLNLENPRKDSALIALAGPFSNILLAGILSIPMRLNMPGTTVLFVLIAINVNLAIFNLLPIHPLDGFKVVWGALPAKLAFEWQKTAAYGMWVLLALLIFPGLGIIPIIYPITQTLLSLLLGS